MRSMILTGSLLLALCSTATAGQIYKWVDAQGQPHFGALPPEGVQSTPIKTSIAPGKPAAAQPEAGKAEEDPQQTFDDKVKQDVAKQQAELKKYCDSLRSNLAQLQNNPRVRVEEKGEVRRLGEDERQAKIAELRQAIDKDCN